MPKTVNTKKTISSSKKINQKGGNLICPSNIKATASPTDDLDKISNYLFNFPQIKSEEVGVALETAVIFADPEDYIKNNVYLSTLGEDVKKILCDKLTNAKLFKDVVDALNEVAPKAADLPITPVEEKKEGSLNTEGSANPNDALVPPVPNDALVPPVPPVPSVSQAAEENAHQDNKVGGTELTTPVTTGVSNQDGGAKKKSAKKGSKKGSKKMSKKGSKMMGGAKKGSKKPSKKVVKKTSKKSSKKGSKMMGGGKKVVKKGSKTGSKKVVKKTSKKIATK